MPTTASATKPRPRGHVATWPGSHPGTDAGGRRWRYSWYAEDRLTSVVTPDGHYMALPLRSAGSPHGQATPVHFRRGGRGGPLHLGRSRALRAD
ncbi:RHS repeat domain-containing protein [Streptomyces sp. NPDC057705]|uniref:RHS repeat domain-containing protein n=1 Tax=Streptomyces sp. NPDC057705 TaxID=3346222 RepID=UPI0036945DCF